MKKVSGHGRLFWIKCVGLYPMDFRMPEEGRASCCSPSWSRPDAAISHAEGMPHFRRFCLEHPDLAVAWWGEEVRLAVAEELLSGVLV